MAETGQLLDEYNMDFGAEESYNLLDNSNLAAVKKMLELLIQVMVIPVVKRIVEQVVENTVRKVVKEELECAREQRVILIARANVNGIVVKEAETEPFYVRDRRTNLYSKHLLPSLSDEVFRLKGISRRSLRYKRLCDAKVNTVAEFLRFHNMSPKCLKQILDVSDGKYNVIINHAKMCSIGEKLYKYNSMRGGREVSAIFDIVRCLRGLLYADKYVSIDKLSEDEKVDDCKIMASAFLDLYNAESIENEASIAHFVPQSSNANGANTSSSLRTEDDADGRSFSPKVPAFEHGQSIENGNFSNMNNVSSTSSSPRIEIAPGRNLFPQTVQLANVPNSLSTENAGVSNFSPNIYAPGFGNVENIEDENVTSITIRAPGSSNAIDANISSIYRTDNITGFTFGIWKMIEENDNASASTASRHLPPVHPYGLDPSSFFSDYGNIDLRIDCPIYSRNSSVDFADHQWLSMEKARKCWQTLSIAVWISMKKR